MTKKQIKKIPMNSENLPSEDFSDRIKQSEISPNLCALTVHAPWAWAIMKGYKTVENRPWITSFRGRFAIHSGRSTTSDARAIRSFERVFLQAPKPGQLIRGALLGTVELVDILPLPDYLEQFGNNVFDREFALGPFCWVLRHPKFFTTPIKCPGNFQLWNVQKCLEKYSKTNK